MSIFHKEKWLFIYFLELEMQFEYVTHDDNEQKYLYRLKADITDIKLF